MPTCLRAFEKMQKTWVSRKEALLNSFVYSKFNWHFFSPKSLYKIEKIQEWALRLLHNDFANDYAELLKNSGKATMEI